MKRLAITTLISLLLTTGIAVAWGGPDGSIDTYFDASGVVPVYHSALILNDGDDGVIEKVWTGLGSVTIVENIDLEDHSGWFCDGYADANLDKLITVDPWIGDAHVEKTAWWDGAGEVYREAWLGDDIYEVVDASTIFGDASFIDSIEYNGDLTVYESVGLNRFATCDTPEMPDPLPMPECGSWFC